MAKVCDLSTLEAFVAQLPKVHRRQTQNQVVYSVSGLNFLWLSPSTGMVQIAPPLGPGQETRRLVRDGEHIRVIRQKTGKQDAEYHDPSLRLKPLWSYPGFMCSQTPQDEAESLVRQAYEQVQSNSHPTGRQRLTSTPRSSSPSSSQNGDTPFPANKVIQVPMEEELVQTLDSWSQKLGRSRAGIIREACRRYLKRLEREELDRIYREGYDRFPEEPIMALTQASLLSQVLPKEEW